jgi:putative DNA primase/helicase
VYRFKTGEPWWLETPELEALATAEQAARYVVDAWEGPVLEWLGDRVDVGLFEVLEHALGLVPERQTQSAQKRVVAILTRMGFESTDRGPLRGASAATSATLLLKKMID